MSSPRRLGPPPGPGSLVGPYRLQERLGAGGLATVWRADGPDGPVAVKVMNPDRTTPEQVTRIHREFQAMQLMDSPHVVKVLSSGEEQGYPYLVLEHVSGGTLEELLHRWEERPGVDRFAESARLLRGLCLALAHIHDRGLVHRDIKPSNILIDAHGSPKLTDFGSVKAPDQFTTNLTMAGHLVGTVAFMAPEQITEEEISPRVDLYALGAVFYVLLTGNRPVEADSIAGYLAKHLMEDPPPPLQVNPACPHKLSRLCMRLLRKDPSQRPQSASEVLEALDAPDTGHHQRLHGRQQDLRHAGQRISELRRGQGGEMAILGLPGSGRSALLGAIAEQASELGLRVLQRRLPGDAPLGQALEELTLEGVVPEPTLLLVDDLDRGTRADMGAIEALLRDDRLARQVLLIYVLTGRTGQPLSEDTAFLLERLRSGLWIDLEAQALDCGPLPRRAIVAMLRDQGLSAKAARVAGQRLHAWCEGRPGGVLQALQAFHEAGWLEASDEGLVLTVPAARVRGGELPVPQAHRELVEGILAEIGHAARQALEALAILDGEADLGLIAGLSPGGPRALSDPRLDPLLLRAGEGLQEQLRFAQKDTLRVVLEGLDGGSRAELNRQAAALLQRKHRRRIGSVAERAATHLLRAGEPAQAWPLLARAASWERRRRRLGAARRLAERSLEVRALMPEPDQPQLACTMLSLQGEVLLEQGEPAEAGHCLHEALSMSHLEASEQARIRGLLGQALLDLGEPGQARGQLQAALEVLPVSHPSRHDFTRALADAWLADGQRAEAARTWERALSAARKSGDRLQEGRSLLGLGTLELRAGNLIRATRALELAEQKLDDGHPRERAACMLHSADLALLDGRLRVALDRARRAMRIARNAEQPDLVSRAQLLLSEAYMSAGQTDECQAILPGLVSQELADPVLDPVGQELLYHVGMQVLGPVGVRGLKHSPQPPPGVGDAARWELYRSWAMIREGASGAALAHAKRCAKLTQTPGMAALRMEALLLLGTLGVSPDQELRELVQRQLSGMPEELRRSFVGRLQRLGLFPG